MLELLAPHRTAHHGLELVVVGSAAQHGAQVRLAQREQAGAQLAVGGYADPVAVGAEGLRDRVDEADAAAAVGEAEGPRGRAGGAGLGLQRVNRMDRGTDLLAAEHVVGRPRVVGVKRHELDEADLVGVLAGEAGERDHLGLGEAAHRQGVDLDRVSLREGGERREAAQDLVQNVAARHLAEALALERVDGDVEARDARVDQRVGVALELVAVGRQRQLVQPGNRGEHRGQARQLAAHERLDLLEGQQTRAVEPAHALRGHAVAAAKAAAVGHREAQIADRAAVAVKQLRACCDHATITGPPRGAAGRRGVG